MLNIDTIRALQKTVISELFRNIFRMKPKVLSLCEINYFIKPFNSTNLLLGAILIYILKLKTQLIVDVYLIGFLILCLISTACTFF